MTMWAVTHQAPLSKQDYWSGLPCPPPGYLPKPGLLHCRQILYHHLSCQRSPLGIQQINFAVYDYFISLELSVKYPVRLMVLLACLLLNHHLDNKNLVNPPPVAATKVPVFMVCQGYAFMERPVDRTQLQIGRKGSSLEK